MMWRWMNSDQQTKCAKWQYEGEQTTNKQTTKCKAIIDMKTMMWKLANNDWWTKCMCPKCLYEDKQTTNKTKN